LKFLLGLDQTWVIIELCLRVNHALKFASASNNQRLRSPEPCISLWRKIVTVIIALLTLIAACALLIADNSLNSVEIEEAIDNVFIE